MGSYSKSETVDVVVVGAGLAGHAAALSAVERGATVLLLEKGLDYGGSSARSGGGLLFSGTALQMTNGVEDDPEATRAEILTAGKYVNDPVAVDVYLRHQLETYDWLCSVGATFTLSAAFPGAVPRLHAMPKGTLVGLLHERLVAAAGADYWADAPANRLVRGADGQVNGVIVNNGGMKSEISVRRGIVLASGGFSHNRDLLRLFAPKWADALNMGGPYNDGDGLTMAWALGAQLADMAYIEATFGASIARPGRFDHLPAEPRLLFPNAEGAIIVNLDARRFVNEDLNYKQISRLCQEQRDGIAIQVFDQKVMDRSKTAPAPRDFKGALADGLVTRADSIVELAHNLQLDTARLGTTIEEYNRFVDAGSDPHFGRPLERLGDAGAARLDTPPYFAFACGNALTSTYCGLQIDARLGVVDVFGDPIEGLYAAGEVVGGFHGAGYVSGTGLGKAAVFGRAAGQSCTTSS